MPLPRRYRLFTVQSPPRLSSLGTPFSLCTYAVSTMHSLLPAAYRRILFVPTRRRSLIANSTLLGPRSCDDSN